jgi:hypothetical protein
VVSLPSDHEGGQLAVGNAGNEVRFDWSKSANDTDTRPCIKWAAFYSDCQHEVLEVTSGHRITLTYKLFVTRGLGHLAGRATVLNTATLPLYKTIRTALRKPDFFREGHVIAIWLTHAYAHTTKRSNFLPASLKGADMSLYETALALGLRCRVVPVGSDPEYSYEDDDEVDMYAPGKFGPLVTGERGDDSECEDWGRPMSQGKYTWVNPQTKELNEAQAVYFVVSNVDEHGLEISTANVISSGATTAENSISTTLMLQCSFAFRPSVRGICRRKTRTSGMASSVATKVTLRAKARALKRAARTRRTVPTTEGEGGDDEMHDTDEKKAYGSGLRMCQNSSNRQSHWH